MQVNTYSKTYHVSVVIPVVMSSMDDELKNLKKEFGGQSESAGFGEEVDVSKSRKAERWELKIANYEKWKVLFFSNSSVFEFLFLIDLDSRTEGDFRIYRKQCLFPSPIRWFCKIKWCRDASLGVLHLRLTPNGRYQNKTNR